MSDLSNWIIYILQRFAGGDHESVKRVLIGALFVAAGSGSILTVRVSGVRILALDQLPLMWVAIIGATLVASLAVAALCILLLIYFTVHRLFASRWNTPLRKFHKWAESEQLLVLCFFELDKRRLLMDPDDPSVVSLESKGVLELTMNLLSHVKLREIALAKQYWVGLQPFKHRLIECARQTSKSFDSRIQEVKRWEKNHGTRIGIF